MLWTMPEARADELRTFRKVGELGSFGAAARELGLSPSAVSKQVRSLEERLGVRLLNRTTRRVSLTELGRLYLERGSAILQDWEELEAEVRGLQASPRGTLRVSAPQDFGRHFLCGLVARFVAAYPELRVEFDLSDRLVDLVEEGFDVAIRIARPRDSSLRGRRLGECERVLCAAPGYLEHHGVPRRPSDLEGHHCIEYAYQDDGGGWRFRSEGRVRQIRPTGRLRTNAGWAMRELALEGQGIALLPSFLVIDDVKEGALVTLLDDVLDADLAVMALFAERAQRVAKVRVFLDFVVEKLAESPRWRERLRPPAA